MSFLLCIQKCPLKYKLNLNTTYDVKEVLESNAYIILRELTNKRHLSRYKYKDTIAK